MRTLRTLHRWSGVVFAALIIPVAVTGILLTHAKTLGLNRITVNMPGYAAASPVDGADAVTLGDGVVITATKAGVFRSDRAGWQRTLTKHTRAVAEDEGTVYAGTVDGLFTSPDGGRSWRAAAEGDFRAVTVTPHGVVAASRGAVFVSRGGRTGPVAAMPRTGVDVRRIIAADGVLLLVAKEGIFSVGDGVVRKVVLPVERERGAVDLQKIVTDLHTGAFFGTWFVILADANALVLTLLSATGLWIWWVPLRRRRLALNARSRCVSADDSEWPKVAPEGARRGTGQP